MTRILFILLLLVSPLFAGWSDNRVVTLDGATGSFVDIGNGTVRIISCAHRTVDTSLPLGAVVNYSRYDGVQGTARVIAVAPFNLGGSSISDCAIFEFSGSLDPAIKPFKISQRALTAGERAWVVGFPMGRFWSRSTTIVSDNGTLYLAGDATPGESGSPIVNAQGELIGILSGAEGDGETMATSRNFLTRCSSRTVCNGLLAQCGGCQGGQCSGGWCTPPAPVQRRQLPPPPQPTTPAMPPKCQPPAASVGPQGPPGPPGPQGIPGCNANCECGPKWVALQAELNQLRAALNTGTQAKTATINFVNESGKIVATTTVTPGTTSNVKLPPINFRIQDQRGPSYSTEYQPAQLGSYVTLPFGPAK